MALVDYRLCDVCDGKVFYDSNLNYEFQETEYVVFNEIDKKRGFKLDYLGAWVVICDTCSETHEIVLKLKGETK